MYLYFVIYRYCFLPMYNHRIRIFQLICPNLKSDACTAASFLGFNQVKSFYCEPIRETGYDVAE